MNDSEQNGWTDGMVFVGTWRVTCGCCPVWTGGIGVSGTVPLDNGEKVSH